MQQIVVCWVANPAFDGNGIVWMHNQYEHKWAHWTEGELTRMENVAQGAIIKNHDFAEIGLDLSKVLDISPVANSAVLSIVPACKILALHLQPVDDGICVLLYRGGEYDQIVPLTNLVVSLVWHQACLAGVRTFFRKSSQYGRL